MKKTHNCVSLEKITHDRKLVKIAKNNDPNNDPSSNPTTSQLQRQRFYKAEEIIVVFGAHSWRCNSRSWHWPQVLKLQTSSNSLLVSMAPMKNDLRPLRGCFPPHLGPSVPEMSSVWFKMFVYHMTGSGPPSLLLPKGWSQVSMYRVKYES
jgi:hypothetical protein